MFENRTYRRHHTKKGLVAFDITVKETNLNIQADYDLSTEAIKTVLECRNTLETYIKLHPKFLTSLDPLPLPNFVPTMIQEMIIAGQMANVGPMAAVAGMVAQYTGLHLLSKTDQILVENGGDIFVKSDTKTIFTIYAKNSPFSMTCGIEVKKQKNSYGICTSSGTLGHSKSFGKADAAMVFSNSCPLADAVATALGNRIKKARDIQAAIDWGKQIKGIRGIVVIKAENIGFWGEDLKLITL
ncbi:MAG: UPF0280 family protein [Pseudomonadota bacterium]